MSLSPKNFKLLKISKGDVHVLLMTVQSGAVGWVLSPEIWWYPHRFYWLQLLSLTLAMVNYVLSLNHSGIQLLKSRPLQERRVWVRLDLWRWSVTMSRTPWKRSVTVTFLCRFHPYFNCSGELTFKNYAEHCQFAEEKQVRQVHLRQFIAVLRARTTRMYISDHPTC